MVFRTQTRSKPVLAQRCAAGTALLLVLVALCGCEIAGYAYYLRFEEIDYLIVRYHWESAGGSDLDTRTAIVDPDRAIDVGWSRASEDPPYLTWGLDNTGSGYEAALVDIKAILAEYPDQKRVGIRLRAFWYASRASGDYSIEFTGYYGGEMVKDGYNWINEGGRNVRSITVQRNTSISVRGDVDGEDAGIAQYEPETKLLVILPR